METIRFSSPTFLILAWESPIPRNTLVASCLSTFTLVDFVVWDRKEQNLKSLLKRSKKALNTSGSGISWDLNWPRQSINILKLTKISKITALKLSSHTKLETLQGFWFKPNETSQLCLAKLHRFSRFKARRWKISGTDGIRCWFLDLGTFCPKKGRVLSGWVFGVEFQNVYFQQDWGALLWNILIYWFTCKKTWNMYTYIIYIGLYELLQVTYKSLHSKESKQTQQPKWFHPTITTESMQKKPGLCGGVGDSKLGHWDNQQKNGGISPGDVTCTGGFPQVDMSPRWGPKRIQRLFFYMPLQVKWFPKSSNKNLTTAFWGLKSWTRYLCWQQEYPGPSNGAHVSKLTCAP